LLYYVFVWSINFAVVRINLAGGERIMQNYDGAAVARLNAGEPIAPVEFSLIERAWNALSRFRREQPQSIGIDLGAVAENASSLSSLSPDQRIAFTVRYGLLDGLITAGILDHYMENAKLRQKVFEAGATLPCDKNDLGEAMMLKRLRESSPDVVEKMKQEMRQAGYDPDQPKLGEKFVSWMDQNV
jgi:hypothetical protein